MRLRAILPVLLTAAFVLSACGSSSKPAATGGTNNTTVTYKKAGKFPSASAKMVCAKEAIDEIASGLGVKNTSVTKPTWKDHLYSCTYVYPNGKVTLAVKELSSVQETTDWFNHYKTSLGGVKQNLFGLGQGAFIAKNNDVVVRKDYKVLLVDMQQAPAANGAFIPAMTRENVATSIASVIMGCWQDV